MQRVLSKHTSTNSSEDALNVPLRFTAEISGPEDGPAVILIHGFPDHNQTFRRQTRALNDAGFRTIAPMLRGYEVSSQRPGNDYHILALADDVLAWMRDLDIDTAHLVGHDWGALISYAVAVRNPERVRSLSLLAVSGLREYLACLVRHPVQFKNSWYMFLFQLPFIAHSTLRADDLALIDRLWADWSPGWEDPERESMIAGVKKVFREPGVVEAAVAYYRSLFDFITPAGLTGFRALLEPIRVPTLALTGARDGCLDTRMFDTLTEDPNKYSRGLRVERIAEAGHFVHLERPDEVNRILLEFLNQHR